MAVRMIYTQYSRRHNKVGLSAASNASAPSYHEKDMSITDEKHAIITEHSTTSTEGLTATTPSLSAPIAIFPQYVTETTTSLTIREDGLPHLPDSFTVSNGDTTLFKVHRDRPSFRHRQEIIDAQTQQPVMTVCRNVGTLPRSFIFVDPERNRIVDLQGSFFVPYTGAKSSAFLLNAETGQKIELLMQGSYRNRHAVIKNKETDEILVTMTSNIFELRNIVGGRRTYNVTIRAGLDMAIVVGLIVALDARAQ